MLAWIGKAALWGGKMVVKDILIPAALTVAVGMALKAIVARLPPRAEGAIDVDGVVRADSGDIPYRQQVPFTA